MDMDEIQMILALRALRELLDNGDRDDGDELVASYRALGKAIVKNKPMTRRNARLVAEYLHEANSRERPIGAAASGRYHDRPHRCRGSRECDAEAEAGGGRGTHPGEL